MTNSDYLLKAAIKKVTEKLNEILVEKIEEATNIAQDAPEILKKEFDGLKKSIIEESLILSGKSGILQILGINSNIYFSRYFIRYLVASNKNKQNVVERNCCKRSKSFSFPKIT